jgi:hypothetical protein
MSLPFHPEDPELLWARYPAALTRVFRAEEIAAGGERPGELRVHVFDWPDGLRMIISREDVGTGRAVLHVSASFEPGTPLFHDMMNQPDPLSSLLELVPVRFRELSGDDRPLLMAAIDLNAMTPHWVMLRDEPAPDA